MKNKPSVIYLQTCGDCLPNVMGAYDCDKCDFNKLAEVTWCKDKINTSDTAYINEEIVMDLLTTIFHSDKAFEIIKQMKGGEK